MNETIAKLQKATDAAEALLQQHKLALDDSAQRVETAKALLRQLDPEEKEKIKVTDTKLPELLDMHALAKEQYETSLKRFETNSRYLATTKEKAGM